MLGGDRGAKGGCLVAADGVGGGAGKKKSHPPLALRDGTEVSAGSPAGPGSGRSVWTPV